MVLPGGTGFKGREEQEEDKKTGISIHDFFSRLMNERHG
jgi:hypothetical protein